MALTHSVPPGISMPGEVDANSNYFDVEDGSEWISYAIPVDSVLNVPKSDATHMVDSHQANSIKFVEPPSPESASTSEASEYSQARDLDRDQKRNLFYIDDNGSETTSESRSDSFERMNGNFEMGQTSPEVGTKQFGHSLERADSSESLLR